MTSPDFSRYIDLTIYDIDAFQAYDDAITYARDSVPEFEPRAGTLEEAIMQAISYNTALLSSQINRLPDGLMEGLARLSGLERREATFATGLALFEVFDDNGVVIPQGTVVAYEEINDDIITSYAFETVTDIVIPELLTSGVGAIRALNAGAYPALLAGQELQLVSPAPGVVTVSLDSSLSVGTNTETDREFFDRAAQHFASLSLAITTKQQLVNYIKSTYLNIGNVAVFDQTDTSQLAWGADPSPGWVTIVLCDANGDPIVTSNILDDITAKMVAGLSVGSADPNPITIITDIEISVADGFDAVETRNAVANYVNSRLSVLGYDFSGQIIKNELISAIANIAGVRYVKDLTFSVGVDALETTSGIEFYNKNDVPSGSSNVTNS